MDAATTFDLLINDGFALGIEGDRLTVRPTSRLTDELREAIRANKHEIMALFLQVKSPDPDLPPLSLAEHDAIREAIAERAAIQEHDGGLSRSEAERQAARAMRVYRFRLTDRHEVWLTMLAPGSDLADARHDLDLRFGPERLIDVQEQPA